MVGRYFFLRLLLFLFIGFSIMEKPLAQTEYEQIKKWANNHQKVDTLLKLAKQLWYHDPDLTIDIAHYAYGIAVQIENNERKADALNIIGAGYYFLENIDSATSYYDKSLELSKDIGYTEGISRVTNNLGLIHDFLGNYDLAIEFYYQSLEIEQNNNNTLGIASAYLNIGSIYYYLNEYDRALEFMTNSLRIYQQEKNEDGILRCFTNIGSAYSEIGILENALTYSFKALELSRKMNNPDLEAANLNNVGKIYFDQNKLSKSIEYYGKALAIEQQYNDLWSQANTLRNIGGVKLVQKEYDEAGLYFDKSLEIAKKLKVKTLVNEIYFDFYSLYNDLKQFETALAYHELYAQLKDSLMGESSRTEIARVESSYKLKYKDQQLELVRKENEVKNLTIKTQKYIIYVFAAIGLLVLTLVIIFYYKARANKLKKTLLEKTNTEISDQKILLEKSIQQLKESEEKYKALTFSIQDGILILKDRKIIYTNDKLCKLLGYKNSNEIMALHTNNLLSGEYLATVVSNYKKRIAGEDVPEEYVIQMLRKSGKAIDVSIKVKRIQYQGEPAIIGTIKDISKPRVFEDKLIKAKEKAEKATLSKSMFLAGMSHEIRNHMNSIIGIADVLGDTKLNKEQKDFVNIIKNSGDTMLEIINEILDLSKIEAGQIILEEQVFKISSILKQVVSLHELIARENKLYLNIELDDGIPEYITGDETRISQILTNLVGNALKFTDKGGITIKVTCLEQLKHQIILKFDVMDTGIGISEDSQGKLFIPFSQTHAAVERKVGGTGLGLVICKHLVRLMDGDIGIQSELEKGSNFWFTAKFKNPDPDEKPIGDFSQSNDIQISKKILLVEDNLLNQHLTTTILEKEGYEADIASNGKEGVDLFQKKQYGIILMDIQMPVMDGLDATRLIREYESNNYSSKSTIIAITAHSKEKDRQNLHEAGIDHFIQKPFKPDELLNIIHNLYN